MSHRDLPLPTNVESTFMYRRMDLGDYEEEMDLETKIELYNKILIELRKRESELQ